MNSTAVSTTLSRPSYTAAVQSKPQPQSQHLHRQKLQTQRRKQPPVFVGRSRNTAMSSAGSSCHVAAAKPYISN